MKIDANFHVKTIKIINEKNYSPFSLSDKDV